MIRWIAACLVVCFASALAQPAQPMESANAQATYDRINEERARETARLDALEAGCYERFAVNRCLQGVKTQRTAILTRLRRQENALRAAERLEQGAAQRQRIADKQAQRAEQDASKGVSEWPTPMEKSPAPPGKTASARAQTLGGAPPPPRAVPGPSVQQQASNREAHARKLAAAEEKRQAVANKQANKTGAPLPLPAAAP